VTTNYQEFKAARDLLLELRDDHDRACAEFRWPRFEQFNWALDWFDEMARGNTTDGVRIVDGDSVPVGRNQFATCSTVWTAAS